MKPKCVPGVTASTGRRDGRAIQVGIRSSGCLARGHRDDPSGLRAIPLRHHRRAVDKCDLGPAAPAHRNPPRTRGELEPARPPGAVTTPARTAQDPHPGVRVELARSHLVYGEWLRRTAQYHLSSVFTKLGISSRNQLDRVLPASPDTARPS
jgi:hypothetical protein